MAKRSRSASASGRAKKKARKYVKKANRRVNYKAIVKPNPRRGVNFGAGFPQKVTMTHKYVERVVLTNGTPSAIQAQLFWCNGMYDVNYSGGGHQPMYFDQISALYDQYTVILSRMKVVFSNQGNIPCDAGVYLNDDTSVAVTTYADASEQTAGRHVLLGSRDSGSSTRTLTSWWGVTKWFGKAPLANDVLRGTSTTNPSEGVYFTIWTQPLDGTTVETVYADVEIEYTAVWTELKDMGSS